ncbi:hypothetical protein [Kaistia sp. MMO-174]|uniref:hypothetical protein n=1 Tax=Kaistia sp. MMO-174 TaxID=3081256 RepID=UPI0030187DE8
MSTVTIEFLGGEDTGNVAETEWANPFTGERVVLPIRQPVEIDPNESAFLAHVVAKARKNRFFKVKDVKAKAAAPAVVASDGDENKG